MNFSDSEIIASILKDYNYEYTQNKEEADILFVNTCSIRDNAEQKVRNRLTELKHRKNKGSLLMIGVLGCMAERLKEKLMEEEPAVDLIIGPDSYRYLPELISEAETGQKGVNVQLSMEETYAEIQPVRYDSNGVSAFISIMRGCENFCSYCVVPYTRGKERSRNPKTIVNEAIRLFNKGYREITLLGQNVNSYNWQNEMEKINFPKLIELVADVSPLLRVRFATSHPKDMSDELLETIARNKNICRAIHLPAQSGSSRILQLMNRKYTREQYLDRIHAIKRIIPDCAISTDLITGFCSETEDDHKETLTLMKEAAYEFAFMFKYSERPGTGAAKKYKDDIPEDIKVKRLTEIINLQQELSHESNKNDVGKTFEVLVESVSKRSDEFLSGRNSQNKVVVFPREDHKPGDYVNVKITDCTAATLKGVLA